MQSQSFLEIINKTRTIIKRFEKIEGKKWGIDGSMIELSKQIGQLSALVMMQENYYPKDRDLDDSQYEVSKEKIGDELSDILFMIIRIADLYGIDLENVHNKALREASAYLDSKKV
jgi:predicted house-cleaning noncanonical NTP pyrophosphatase (MazG superfamily)